MPISTTLTSSLATVLIATNTFAQDSQPIDVPNAIEAGVARILEMQEGDANAEWPYEGVYRVRDSETGRAIIPIGYRVGGTSICAMAIMQSPGYSENEPAKEAIERAAAFVIASVDHELMQYEDIIGTYDVRGWGYTYGLLFLLNYNNEDRQDEIDRAVNFYLNGIAATEIPQRGGWNYARRGGFDKPGGMSPFMTGPTIQALMLAKEKGYEIDEGLIERGLESLLAARLDSGAYVYSGTTRGGRSSEKVPGAVGRMLVSEATLYMNGKATLADVRGAVDAFLVHWEWLDKRRQQTGTHIPPYGIAPYYFYFAHYYAAQAIELLPEQDQGEYHRRLREKLFVNRQDGGTWNDRVFERSANYGTAMSIMALTLGENE